MAARTPTADWSPDPGDPQPPERNFGEEGGRLSYGGYLRLPALLAQQVPLADPPAHDERLFIVVHQVYELWFSQLLFELETARDAMFGADLRTARRLLQRVSVIERVLVDQLQVLETMDPQDFLEFRTALAPASGFQSVQFRELEFLSGAKDAVYLERLHDATPEEAQRLRRRFAEPTLWHGYLAALASRGLAIGSAEERRRSLLTVARDRDAHADLWELGEALICHDDLAAQWRARHVTVVERHVGTKSGTGGTTGAPYLRSRLGVRFYPELWEVRSWL